MRNCDTNYTGTTNELDFSISRGIHEYLERFYDKAILLVIEKSEAGLYDWKYNSFSLTACSEDKMLGSIIFRYPNRNIDVNEIVKKLKELYPAKSLEVSTEGCYTNIRIP